MKLLPLFFNESLRGVAISWLSLFTSFFIYQNLLQVTSFRLALAGVALFWTLFGVGQFLGNCFAENMSQSRGLKSLLYLGILLLGVTFILFDLVGSQFFLLLPAALTWGFSAATYWFGWRGMVGKLSTEGKYGRSFGTSALLRSLFDFVSPFIGGVIINFWGYRTLFGIAIVIMFFSLLALRFLREEKTHRDTRVVELFSLFLTHKRVFLTYFSQGVIGIIGSVCFILYLAIILEKELAMGGFFSASVFLVAIITFFIGKRIDQKKRKELVVVGSITRSLVWLGRLLTKNVPFLLGLNVANDLSVGMVDMPFSVRTLEKAVDGRSTGRAILFQEIAASLGQIITGIVLVFLTLLGFPLTTGFFLASLFALIPLLTLGHGF